MKKAVTRHLSTMGKWKKILLIMKLKIFFFICCIGTMHANTNSQVKHFSLNKHGAQITNILNELQSESDYQFFYQKDIFNNLENVDINLKKASIEEVLEELLTRNGYRYELIGNVITIRKTTVAQQGQDNITVVGTVKGTDGLPIPGVNITIKNRALGTISDPNGQFSITVPSTYGTEFTLVFSFIGMEKTEVNYTGQPIVDVVLKADLEEIDEVVVTGYQVIDKRELTSAIETIKSDDLDKISALTIDQMIEGKVSGLMVTNLSSTPGAAAKIRVRSGGTFTGSRAPLWVVDGIIYEDPVPLSADDINSFDKVNLIGNALTGLNPQDIESINILKDASATAIYGTRAANGVIVVTTKRGKKGKPSLSYRGSMSVVDRPYYSDFNLMNSLQRTDVSREMHQKNLGYPEEIITWVGYEKALHEYRLGDINFSQFQTQVGEAEVQNTDWFGALYRPAINTKHSISMSGGSDNVRYYYSVGYDSNKGTEKGVGLKRLTSRANMDMNITEKVHVSLSLSGSVQEAAYNYNSVNVFDEAYYNSRVVPFENEDGSLFYMNRLMDIGNNQTVAYNVMNEMNNSERNVDNKDFNVMAQFTWDITKGIKLRASGSYRTTTNMQESWIKDNTAFIAELRTYDSVDQMSTRYVNRSAEVPFGGLYSSGYTSQNSLRGQVQLNMSKVVAEKHAFNLNLGYEANSNAYKGSSGWTAPGYNHEQGRSFITLPRTSIDPDTGDLVNYGYTNMLSWLTDTGSNDLYPSITDRLTNQLSMYSIFNYSYDNRYIVNFNIRSDGSNKFGQYERYKFKPVWSTSARWNIHNENFWNRGGLFDELAMRVSYGFRGSPPSETPYMIITDYQYSADFMEDKARISGYPNASLVWEKTSTVNAGLNYSLLNGRLSGAFDMAYSHGTDLLLSRPVSLVNGRSTQQFNGGEKEDYTYEISLSGTPLKVGKWGVRISANATWLNEKILAGYEGNEFEIDVNDYLDGSIYKTGFPIDGFYSYQFDGLNEEGLPTYKNLENETESIDQLLSEVLIYSGRRSPRVYGGFNTEVRYDRFTLRAGFSYKLGHKVRRLNLYNGQQNMPMPHENLSAEFLNRWRQPGDEVYTNIPGLSNNPLTISQSGNGYYSVMSSDIVPSGASGWDLYDLSDERVVDGSHIRWQTISLSYSAPKKLLNKLGIGTLTVSGNVDNVAVWAFDKDLKGQDPEQVQGVGMPALPTYSISLNLGL